MEKLIDFVFNRDTKIPDAASFFGRLFQTNEVEDEFYSSVVTCFVNFDEFNQYQENKSFSNDLKFILKCTIDDIPSSKTSKKSSQRIESYFYIYHRIEQYIKMSRQGDQLLHELRQKLFEFLRIIFTKTEGKEPNICLRDKDVLQETNIFQHLSSIVINKNAQTLHTAFVLFKLSIQSSIIMDGNQNHLTWKDMLSKLRDINYSLEDFVDQYIIYKNAFQQCPLDIPAFIYLIQKMHPPRSTKSSPFIVFFKLCQKLNFNEEIFLKEFRPLFDDGLRIQRYETQHINEFLISLGSHDQLFYEYLSTYSSNVLNDNLWDMFLNLSKISNLNENMRKHLSTILSKQISTVSSVTFQKYARSAKECLKNIRSPQTQANFVEIFEQVYDTFVLKVIQSKGNTNQSTERTLKELFNVCSPLLSKNHIKKPSNLLVLQQLLFKTDPYITNTNEKIKRLFQNVKDFDENMCRNNNPVGIIQDEWLNDFMIVIPQGWRRLDQDTYRYLCNNFQQNRWIIHIWSKIVYFSLLKTIKDNLNKTLSQLNEWMTCVKHDVYSPDDILTIIFVKYLFELIIVKYTKSIVLLPNIETIIRFVISIKEKQPTLIDAGQFDDFIQNGCQELELILQLKGTRSTYVELLNGTIIRSLLSYIDLKKLLTSAQAQQYRFPQTTPKIDAILSLRKPRDINITIRNSKEEFFDQFIHDINEWLPWLDKFIDIFQPMIEWFKTYHVNRTNQLALDLNKIKDDPKITILQLKTTVEDMSKILLPFNDLRRLCHLLNCLTSFRILEQGTLNNQINVANYIKELERFHSNNTFTVESGNIYEQKIPINDHQNVRWSLVSVNYPCNIKIEYRTDEANDQYQLLYENNNTPINRNVLQGQFETERSGQLIITINNRQNPKSHVLWYRIRSMNLSTCHLFHGILQMIYRQYYGQSYQIIPEKNFSELVDLTFLFIDKLLNGSISLRDMADLRTVFCDKNIHIREEVEKLFTSRSMEQRNLPDKQDIEQVCEWLQIYQYYSHISVIMDCIAKFDLLSNDSDDESIGHLQRLGANENCNLKEITQAFRIIQQRFQNLTHQHLKLIQTAVECSNVIHMMRKADLYSDKGRSRFQKLRDHLTTQFQLQERNNMILNSWIVTYALVEPFIYKVKKFDDFLARIARLSSLEESSLNHIKIINDNIQIVNMWLSSEDTTVLDNALITMEHLYKTGTVDIRLRHLLTEQSYFEISYTIDRIQGQIQPTNENNENDRQEPEKIKFTLSMAEIDDHKRQLTFCNVDVQQNIFYSKALILGQLKLLQTIERIYSALKKLEMAGHPDYQLREEHYKIHLQYGKTHQNTQLGHAVKTRTDTLELVYERLNAIYTNWIDNLEKSRQECFLLKLFSNRQIMILIILLRTSAAPNSIRNCFLRKLFSFKNLNDQTEEEYQLTLLCLKHYLSSIRIQQCNDLADVYKQHQIEPSSNTEVCLKKLCLFLKDLFNNGNELMEKRIMADENQQYLVTLNSTEKNSFGSNLDINTFCILLNIFNNRLPSSFQILWCSTATIEDIQLFFSRIRTFHYLTFVIMDIDQMHHRFREKLLNEQDSLTREQVPHGTVYYFSRELTTSRNGLREFLVPAKYRNSNQTYRQLITLFQRDKLLQPEIQIICGTAGIGKTHRINTQYKDADLSCFSINDNLNLSKLISSFLLFDSKIRNNNPSIYFNISIHAPFEELNRTLFSLFICRSLIDIQNGLIFSLPIDKGWKFIIEVPYSDLSGLSIKENFNQILPLLSIISPSNLEEVTSNNYQLYIGEEEEVVARFLKAYENKTIDRLLVIDQTGTDHPVAFDPIINPDECRDYIYNCMINYAPDLPRNKIYELSFTKFLYRRVRFFLGPFYCMNQTLNKLGSTAMKQMIDEARSLTKMNFKDDKDPYRVFLVYDPIFSLHLLHPDWNLVSYNLKTLFDNRDPLTSGDYRNKDYFVECLAWLIDIPYNSFEEIMNERKFILTENFAYKIFHVHERKLTKLALIIEGDTGVGKTFLLKFYSELLNSKTTRDRSENSIIPRIVQNTSLWLRKIIITMVENQAILLNAFVHQTKRKVLGLDNNNDDEHNLDQVAQQVDVEFLNEIKLSLENSKYDEDTLQYMWKTILTISSENHMENTPEFIEKLHDHVTSQLVKFPLIEPSIELRGLLQEVISPTVQLSIKIFEEYLSRCQIKPLFYRLLLHPGITEEQVAQFMTPITELARELSHIELVVFFDEVNTSSCLGLFKEMFMDGTLHGTRIPKNIFFTAAINPYLTCNDSSQIHRTDFIVHQLPQSLENLVVPYGSLESRTLSDYIFRKIAMFQVSSSANGEKPMPLDSFVQQTLAECILIAQEFCERRLGRNTVSQREIQRCFTLIEFFWRMRYDNEIENGQSSSDPNPIRCIALSIALIYYFRLPTKEDNSQRNDRQTPSREELAEILSRSIPEFDELIQIELETFVNTDNFVIPQGVAINQAVREHIFSIVVSIATRTPLCIIGVPGQSKTLSFQIVLQNLQGSQLSPKPFCKRLPAIDPFFCLGSKYSRSEDIAYIFDRAIKREQQYEQNRMNTRCVVFLDEASLPDEKKMVLKVLHPYLDECKVAFVAIANKSFDAANANRMICIYRSLPSEADQKILAYGCLGLKINHNQLDDIIYGLCQGYRRILHSPDIPHIFHDRDFIYMLRELRFELSNILEEQELSLGEITPNSLLRALEDNFHGIKQNEFEKLVEIFFKSVKEKCLNFDLPNKNVYRDIPTILRQSMNLDSKRRKLYGRYKLIIDESEDESAVQLLFQSGILNPDPNQTAVFRMSDFPDDIDNELRNVAILSTIKLCMETGKTILMVNTGRIHGALYDVFNQNFSIMATDDTRKIFSKVAIGPKTIDVVVHEDFQCIVHIKRSEFKDIPAPFLSRFQKYALSVTDFYSIYLKQLPKNEQLLMKSVEEKLLSFIQHFGQQYFYGLNASTIYSCLFTLIQKDENGQYYLSNVHRNYSQLTIKSQSFIEHNSADIGQCLLYSLVTKLLQLVSPEAMIYKLRTFEEKTARLLCNNYFYQQEHLNIEKFLQRFISIPSVEIDNNDLSSTENIPEPNRNDIHITTKLMIFTRTSAFVTSLNKQSKNDLFDIHEKIDVLNLAIIENSDALQEQFRNYEQDDEKQVLIIVVDGRIGQQRLHIPFLRQLIDKTDKSCNIPHEIPRKFFLMLIHSTSQELDHQLCFPSMFLHYWDYYFLDTSTSGSAFHPQRMLQIFTSSFNKHEHKNMESFDDTLSDLNKLFNDSLWDFCSRLQIISQDLPSNMFRNNIVYEFYQRQTSTLRRVQCLKEILQQSAQLQERIVKIYYENVAINQKSSQKTAHSIYQISKDILCGKRSNSLMDSLQSQIRVSFTTFVSNVFKFIVNDYGLETLSKLSNNENGYESLLNLIDYSSFVVNDDMENDPQSLLTTQGIFQLANHYSCIPQTPLYYLFHQRIKTLADEIKLTQRFKQNDYPDAEDDAFPEVYNAAPPPTTMSLNNRYNNTEETEYTSQEFRHKLIESMMNDKVLVEIISQPILQSYINDTVRTLCSIVEKSFNTNLDQCQQTIEFVSRWLLLIDENDSESFNRSYNKDIWLLAHVYTFFEYDQNDLFSLYSACRITDQLDPTQSFYHNLFQKNEITRSSVRENLFQLMFDYLWKNLRHLCSTDDTIEQWIHSYTFISKYYPSDKVLQHMQLVRVKGQIEFMNLVYLIFLNEKTPEPKQLVLQLLKDTLLINDDIDGRNINYGTSVCLKLIPIIIDTIHKYLENENINNSTLMIDIQQWIISTLKSSGQSCEQEIKYLLKFLNQPTCQLSLSMKQFLFDEVMNILFKLRRQNRPGANRQNTDFWDRIILLPIICESITDTNLQNYQLPYHPSIFTDDNLKQILFDLFFFHLRRLANDEMINYQLINKILMSGLPSINDRRLQPTVEIIFKQLKDYFSIKMTALLFCEKDLDNHDQQKINHILHTIIEKYLSIDPQPIKLSKYVELFLSAIITKRSWNYLLNLLQSERFQRLNAQWSNTLHRLLEIIHTTPRNQSLQLCHQLQFTLTTNTTLSIFPKLHQPYEELSKLIDQCIKANDLQQRWKPLSDWIQLKLNANPLILNSTEIKVMLLLNIYYDYYCNNRLASLDTLLVIIENTLQPLPEELRVFRVFLQPEQYMIDYPRGNNAVKNHLNHLFKLDCTDEDELSIRHSLVNLLAMILLSGKQNFLWTFTFEPLTLQNTFGFGSTRHEIILAAGVHYDCGCLFSENGDLIHFPSNKGNGGALSVPAVYVAYFSTFGAFAWHLLLFEPSTANLYGPILAKHAIDDTSVTGRIAGDSVRTKVCHFVRARLLSTYHFLSIRSNQDDACMLLNRCFEQMAHLTRPENLWMKPVYTKFEEKIQGEQEYQNQIFYPIHQQLAEYKQLINSLHLQSQIQKNLQEYVSQMPVVIQFQHFKTELSNPENVKLSLNILRNILDSFDFLKMTHCIYDLSQFYLLLHQTYTQLIEREEFSMITLNELYERGQTRQKTTNRLNYTNQNNQHLSIIENGIKAVNTYHKFADGLIRPGACDETQRFTTISIDTPISYLVTTENYDEGDIIMRILSVLVDYHNSLLDLLEKEMKQSNENNGFNLLKDLINKLSLKNLSILQIVQENTGVITLNDNDCLWIERLSRASLENEEEYFPKFDKQFNFNFLYIQFYIIRSYLLVCPINYQHIHEKYQCYTHRSMIVPTDKQTFDQSSFLLTNPQFHYLQEMTLSKLYHGFHLLQEIIDMFKRDQQDFSNVNLLEFIQTIDNRNELLRQIETYGIRDFQLYLIDDVCQLHEQLINNFHSSIINISSSLRVPMDQEQNDKLDQSFDETFLQSSHEKKTDELQSTIRTITEFLNELKDMEDILSQKSSQSLTQTYKDIYMEDSIFDSLLDEIKCENYISIIIKFIEIRSKLQEQIINKDEENNETWDIKISDPEDIPDTPPITPDPPTPDCPYRSLFELNIKSIPLTPSILFNEIRNQIEPSSPPIQELHFTIRYIDGTSQKYPRQIDELYNQFKQIFEEKKYDSNQFVIIDQNHLFVDFTNEDTNTLVPYISEEYHVIDKTRLIPIVLEFDDRQMQYFATKECRISSILHRFIIDQELQMTSDEMFLGFFDQFGIYIEEDHSIKNIYQDVIQIKVIQCENQMNKLSEVTLRSNEDEQETKFFDPETKWEQIFLWSKTQKILSDIPLNTYQFWDRKHGNILDEQQSISSILDDFTSTIIDGFTTETEIEIILSYDQNQQISQLFESIPVVSLLNQPKYHQELNLQISLSDCLLVLIQENDKKTLSKEDMQEPIGNYLTNDHSTLRFEIWMLIQLIQYDDQQEIEIPIPNRNFTINHLLTRTNTNDIYQYVAFIDTHLILSDDENLSNLIQTKFFLVKESQTCLVSIHIETDEDNTINQRYINDATIANIYKQNASLLQDQYLVDENGFIPSNKMPLTSFLQATSTIQFTVIDRKFPANVTVIHEAEGTSVQFYCLPSISIQRVCQRARQLFNLNQEDYYFTLSDQTIANDEVSLDETGESMDNIILRLKRKTEKIPPPSPDIFSSIIEYTPIFELNLTSVSLTASVLFEKIRDQHQQVDASVPPSNISRFETIYPDGARKRSSWRTMNLYAKLKTIFEEKNYSFDEFVLVDANQIFVDFLNDNNDQSSPRISPEYHILQKALLIPLILEFQSEEFQYLVTLKCQISSIINHFITDHQLKFTSPDIYLGFFDELGLYIHEDKPISDIYHSNNRNTFRIQIIKYEDNTNNLYQVTLGSQEGNSCFHPNTTWQQIDLWLKTTNTFTESYHFFDKEQQIIIPEDQSISSTSTIIDGVNNEEVLEVLLSYETNQQKFHVLKSSLVSDLLQKQYYLQQLKVQIPFSNCILVRISETDHHILTTKDLQQPIGNFSSADHQEIHFQIAILIQIIQYDNQQLIPISISNRNTTINQLLQMIPMRDEIYQYLASFETHMIISNTEQLSNLMETKFHLVKDNEICSIIIGRSETTNERILSQRYTIFATIADLYKQNEDLIKGQYLLFNNSIVLSPETPLQCFLQLKSPIRFTLINKNFQASITITNNEEKDFQLKFQCSPSIEVGDLFQIACQLFHVNRRFYQLIDSYDADCDESLLLYELTETVNDVQFKLVSIADVKCLIISEEKTTTIPASNTTLASTVLEEALEKFLLPKEEMNMYVLKVLDDPENPSDIDMSMTMTEILTTFSIESRIIPFQLTKE